MGATLPILASFILSATQPGAVDAQEAALHETARITHTLDRPFTRISGLTELRSGRLVITDSQERSIVIADLKADSSWEVGRHGQGPRELLSAFAPMLMPDGSVLIYDVSNRRFLEMDQEGKPVRVIPFFRSPGTGSAAPPRGVDRAGNLYWETSRPFDGFKVPTVGWIVSWTPGQESLNRHPDLQIRDREGRKILKPLIARDGWSVAPDGSIGIVRASESSLSVEWHSPGEELVHGPAIAASRFPVSDDEIRAMLQLGQSAGGRIRGGDAPLTRTARDLRKDDWIFPEFLPLFDSDRVYASPQNRLWVQRRLTVSADESQFWVFGPDGSLEQRVSVAGRVQLAGVGSDYFYAFADDDLGFIWLRRYELGGS